MGSLGKAPPNPPQEAGRGTAKIPGEGDLTLQGLKNKTKEGKEGSRVYPWCSTKCEEDYISLADPQQSCFTHHVDETV